MVLLCGCRDITIVCLGCLNFEHEHDDDDDDDDGGCDGVVRKSEA